MDSQFKPFFNEIKYFITFLEIEKAVDAVGCSKDEIKEIETKFGKLPIAYKAYLESFGQKFLFSFFDGAQFSYSDYEDIDQFVKQTFKTDKFEIKRPYIAIGHRRYEYFYFFYLDEPMENDPILWWYTEYTEDDEENPTTGQQKFTSFILAHFEEALNNHPAGFHFVDINETDKNIIKRRYESWARKIVGIVDYLNFYHTENILVKNVHDIFLTYFNSQKTGILNLAKSYTEFELKTSENKNNIVKKQGEDQSIQEKENANEDKSITNNDKNDFWSKMRSWFP